MTEPLEIGARRRCDNDGRWYTVKAAHHKFCSDICRKQFHRFGSPFLRLRDHINKEVERASEQIEYRIFSILDHNSQERYRRAFPQRGRSFDEQAEQSASQAS